MECLRVVPVVKETVVQLKEENKTEDDRLDFLFSRVH